MSWRQRATQAMAPHSYEKQFLKRGHALKSCVSVILDNPTSYDGNKINSRCLLSDYPPHCTLRLGYNERLAVILMFVVVKKTYSNVSTLIGNRAHTTLVIHVLSSEFALPRSVKYSL